jgi:hypothetical protein
MEQEGAIGDALDLHALERADGLDDRVQMRFAGGLDGDVAHLLALLDPDEVDRPEEATRVADSLRDPRERPRRVRQVEADGGAVGRGQAPNYVEAGAECAVASLGAPRLALTAGRRLPVTGKDVPANP